MSDDLHTMIPTPNVLTIRGEAIDIRPIKVKQLPEAIRVSAPIVKYFKDSDLTNLDVLAMIGDNLEAVLNLVATLSGKSREWVDDLEMDELVDTFSALVEANVDFFTKNVLPSVLRVMARMQPAVSEAKMTPMPGPKSFSA